jgi:hypothetical protein
MEILNKLKTNFARFMTDRNGADHLGFACLLLALIVNTLDTLIGRPGLFALLGTALYIWTLFRMLSKNLPARREENRRFMEWVNRTKPLVKKYWVRLKNIKDFKYFDCPQCKASIRMKRGLGEKKIICPRCKHNFRCKS